MHYFLIVRVPPGRSIDDLGTAMSTPGSLTFDGREPQRLRWVDRSGALHVTGWSDDPVTPWTIEDAWLRAVSGVPVATLDASPIDAIGRPDADPASGLDRLDNFYGAMSLGSSGPTDTVGWVAADPFGIHPVYVGRHDGFVAVSNDSRLVARVLAAVGSARTRDASTVATVSLIGHTCGNRTGFEGIEVLPLGHAVVFTRSGVDVERIWDDPWTERPHPLDHREVDLVHERLCAFTRAAVGRSGLPVQCELTGGKDSRLVLALTAEAGVMDALALVTSGDIDRSDSRTAAQIAERLGLRWHAEPWPSGADFAPSDIVINAGLTGGQLGAGLVRPSRFEGVTLAGFMGETLNSNYPGWRCDTKQEAVDAKRRYCERLPSYLTEEARGHAVDLVLGQLDELDERGCAPSSLIDAYYVESRIRRWVGCRPSRWDRHVFPLYSPMGTRAAFAAGRASRSEAELLAALFDRTDLGLDDVPFVKETLARHADPKQAFEEALRAKIERDPAARAALAAALEADDAATDRPADERSEQGVEPSEVVDQLLGQLRPDSAVFDVFDTARMVDDGHRLIELDWTRKRALHAACAGVAWLGELDP